MCVTIISASSIYLTYILAKEPKRKKGKEKVEHMFFKFMNHAQPPPKITRDKDHLGDLRSLRISHCLTFP